MRKAKRFNTYPFIALTIIHTILLVYAFYKNKERKKLFVLLMSNISLAYHFEYIVVNLLDAYRYRPMLFKNKYFDNISGAILSQAVFVPFTALFITAFQLGWKVKWLFSLYFTAIEMLFVRIDVYRQRWWKTIYTTLLLPFYFYLSDAWYKHLKRGTPFVLGASLYNFIAVTHVNLLFFLAINQKLKLGFGTIRTWRKHFIAAPLYTIVMSICTALSVQNRNPMYDVEHLYFSTILDRVLIKRNILNTKQNMGAVHVFILLLSYMYRRLIYGSNK